MSIKKDFEDFDSVHTLEFIAVPTLDYLASQAEILNHIDSVLEEDSGNENKSLSRTLFVWYTSERDRIADVLKKAYNLHEELNYLSWPKPDAFERKNDGSQ